MPPSPTRIPQGWDHPTPCGKLAAAARTNGRFDRQLDNRAPTPYTYL